MGLDVAFGNIKSIKNDGNLLGTLLYGKRLKRRNSLGGTCVFPARDAAYKCRYGAGIILFKGNI